MKIISRMVLCVFIVALVRVSQAAPPLEQRKEITRAHYLIFKMNEHEEITLVSDTEVTMRSHLKSDDELMHQTKRGKKAVIARVFDRQSRETFKKTIEVERQLRVEWPETDGTLRGAAIDMPVQTFVVRVPASDEDDAIEIETHGNGRRAKFPLKKRSRDKLTATTNAALLPQTNFDYGDPANRVDILVLGDGYTAAQESKFDADVETVMGAFFAISPYQEYQNYHNVIPLFVASAQSGADHPACTDPSKDTDPLEGTYRNTAFDATYCYGNIQRLLVADLDKVFDAAEAYPDWDTVVVIVNDNLYGGSGGRASTLSLDAQAISTARHEYGHTFSGLGDEYDSGTQPSTCSDAPSSNDPCEPNITDRTTLADIKWNAWIQPNTPVPTPESPAYDNLVGLFQGAAYDPNGHYRPKNSCLMQTLGAPFCEVCKQTYVLTLYNWVRGIDTYSPLLTDVYTGPNQSTSYGVTPLSPDGGPAPSMSWRVDGVVVSTGTTWYPYTPTSVGTHTVEFKIKDNTTLVNASVAGTALETTQAWTVHVIDPAPPSNFQADGLSSYIRLQWNPVANASGYVVEQSTDNVNWSYITTVSGASSYYSYSAAPGAYLMRITTVDEHYVAGTTQAKDLAVVFARTDETLDSTVRIKAAHINEVRTAINGARAQFFNGPGAAPVTYTSTPATGGLIHPAHITETRQAILGLRSALGLAPYIFTDETLDAGGLTKRQHAQELRDAM